MTLSLVLGNLAPEILLADSTLLSVVVDVERSIAHGAGSDSCVAADDVLVVTVILGEGFLDDGNPEGTFIALFSPITEASEEGIALAVQRKVVINDDGVRNTESEEVHSVDAVWAKLVCIVEEHFLNSAWDLCHCGAGRQEPAVAESSLLNVIGVHTIGTKKGMVREGVLGPGPSDLAGLG